MNELAGREAAVTTEDGERVLARQWLFSLVAMALALLAILLLYRETALDIAQIWMRSETFTHGVLVPPISLWLIWRLRDNLARLTPRAAPWSMLALAAVGFAWLLGELATVGALAQFALVTMLVLAVPAILGWPVARRIAFPLAFLYFAVPFGEFALPQLMEWTASFTVLGLRLSGIPVYREGLHFIIPSGSWSVIEACSGVRYLIASLCVGTLFAYLNYRSLRRRLVFVAISFVVPVVANWLRAYMIVMIGHLSGNTLAVGVDHLIYGWVFFGMVIGAMFWIGARWREDEDQEAPQGVPETPVVVYGGRLAPFGAALSVVVLAGAWPLAQWQIEQGLPPPLSGLEVLGPIADWPAAAQSFTDWTPRFETASARLQTSFGSPERAVGLFLGYYRNQNGNRKMVSSGNVLVGSTDPLWAKVNGGSRPATLDRQEVVVSSAELRSVDAPRLVVWQWYWVDGHLTASDYLAKVYTALSRLAGRGDDSAVIIVYAPKEPAGGGEAAVRDFVSAAWPEIESALRRTRDQR